MTELPRAEDRAAVEFPRSLSDDDMDQWHRLPAFQQPVWEDGARARECRRILAGSPGLVTVDEVGQLRAVLARCAAGDLNIVQIGNCAEHPEDSAPERVRRMVGLIDALAGVWQSVTGTPAVRVGRMAGQYAKPRSQPSETVAGRRLAVYRGHMVNRPEAGERSRRHLADHMLECYRSARQVLAETRRLSTGPAGQPRVWASHEALVLDYELPLLRRDADGRFLLASTHWPWVGERTRQPEGAHVRLLASVINPVACKVGPSAAPDEVVELCETLNPARAPGRLTLIARMGADQVLTCLPPLVSAVRDAGHPVVWMCDPMHANTHRRQGLKTRLVEEITAELQRFHRCVSRAGGVPGGVHLEATPGEVTECIPQRAAGPDPQRYRSLCDPRLNTHQALSVLKAAAQSAAAGPVDPGT
ncbi:3-deoxy-7-phosphoheptulonate synthase [Streptomyces smyrnaeus]|uniref:3-deoxy-7-phosphoheptulonate synthase n=1 Tax=Streptomyces smyrnaeus TaxID=1387713 RepID=UPI0033CF1B21